MQHSQHPPLPAQLENESAIQYHMFQQWIYLGPVRTVREMAEHFQCSRKHIYALIKKFDWQERAATYDIEVAQIRHEEILKRNHNFKEQERILVESLYTNLLKLGTKLRIDVITLSEVPSEEKAHKAKEDDIRISRQMLTLYRYTRLLEKYRRLLGMDSPNLIETTISLSKVGAGLVPARSSHSAHAHKDHQYPADENHPAPGLTDEDLAEIDQIAEDIHTHFQTKTDSYLITDELKDLIREHNKAIKENRKPAHFVPPQKTIIEMNPRKALPPARLTAIPS